MLTPKVKIIVTILIIIAFFISGLARLTFAQVTTQSCEACGMPVAADCQAHLTVVDSNGTFHYVECFKCALKLLKTYGELNITTNCDWYGPNHSITVNLKDKVNTTIVNSPNALFIDGSCTKNRIVYDQTAADALLASNGTSPYITAIQNVTIPANATVMTIVQAATFAFTSSPTPTPSPNPSFTPSPTVIPTPTSTSTSSPSATPVQIPKPTPTSSPLVTQKCEVCGMEVTAEAQTKYVITHGNGALHYAECFMCALNLVNKYDKLDIITYCDWYGLNYPITIQSSQYGKEVTVNPPTALFMNGGSCVINRAAYNQTAADLLLANGYSQHTLLEQRYALPSDTKVSSVVQAALMFNQNKPAQSSQTIPFPLIIGVIAGGVIIVSSVVAYHKINSKTKR